MSKTLTDKEVEEIVKKLDSIIDDLKKVQLEKNR